MSKELALAQEALKYAPELATLGLLVVGMAYTKDMRQWFIERDEGECQFPVVLKKGAYKNCGRTRNLQVHHGVMPQRYGKEHGFTPEEIDVPENGITLCEDHHQGVIHNDMLLAKLAYAKNKQSYSDAFKDREERMKNGEKYWNSKYDYWFWRIIQARNKVFDKAFPYNRKQKKKLENGGLRPLPAPERNNG